MRKSLYALPFTFYALAMAENRLEEIREGRLAKRKALLDAGRVPYPSEVRRTHTVAEALEQFSNLLQTKQDVTLVGRLRGIRRHGGLMFLDLHDESGGMQLQITRDTIGEERFEEASNILDIGDWVEAAGDPIESKRGIATIQLSSITIVSKAILPLPDEWYGLKDHELRYRQRELDLLLNKKSRETLAVRSKVLQLLRQYFIENGYLEVETPTLQPVAGGAAAKPFVTHHNALDMPLYLRVAAELYLKRLLVSGYEKVFEIGYRFRNEGISRQHNPEFTMLESQWAYADYEDYMDFTEKILHFLVTEIAGSEVITWQGDEISFALPFERKRYVDLVSERLGVNILENKDPQTYIDIFEKEGLALPETTHYGKLVDELYKELIRPTLQQPTLLYDYPIEMAPLAKANATDPRVAEKFQLLVHGQELVNAYTELNDPVIQRHIFEEQQAAHEAGDDEAHAVDKAYLNAMEYGMPPNAGWGLGVDRLIMFLTDSANIRDTITFPLLRLED